MRTRISKKARNKRENQLLDRIQLVEEANDRLLRELDYQHSQKEFYMNMFEDLLARQIQVKVNVLLSKKFREMTECE